MPEQGPYYPRAGINLEYGHGASGNDWSDPNLIDLPDSSYSYVKQSAVSAIHHSQYLYGYNFGFEIPTGATIIGVELTINRYVTRVTNTTFLDKYVYIGADLPDEVVCENKANVSSWPTRATSITYGGESDTWRLADYLTPARVNARAFGAFMIAEANGIGKAAVGYVDYYAMTIHYEESITEDRWPSLQFMIGGT